MYNNELQHKVNTHRDWNSGFWMTPVNSTHPALNPIPLQHDHDTELLVFRKQKRLSTCGRQIAPRMNENQNIWLVSELDWRYNRHCSGIRRQKHAWMHHLILWKDQQSFLLWSKYLCTANKQQSCRICRTSGIYGNKPWWLYRFVTNSFSAVFSTENNKRSCKLHWDHSVNQSANRLTCA